MEVVQSTIIKLSDIEVNKGQIPGLPGNPRFILNDKFEKLKESIQKQEEMLQLRELLVFKHGKKYVIIGGNMRYQALLELGYKETPCKIIPAGTPLETLKAYTLKDNSSYGEWDFEQLSVWNPSELDEWALDIPDRELQFEELTDDFELETEKGEAGFNMSFFLTKEQAEKIEQTLDAQMCEKPEALMKIMKEWRELQQI